MSSNVDSVRVTNQGYEQRKKHMFVLLAAALGLIAIGIAGWMMLGPSTLYPVRVNGKFGYINKSAKMMIPPQFDQAEPFAEGYAPVRMGGNWGFIDQSGTLTISPQYH